MVPRCRRQFNKFVRSHKCYPFNRQISVDERTVHAKGRKTPLWFSSVTFTPEVQKLFLHRCMSEGVAVPEKIENMEIILQPTNTKKLPLIEGGGDDQQSGAPTEVSDEFDSKGRRKSAKRRKVDVGNEDDESQPEQLALMTATFPQQPVAFHQYAAATGAMPQQMMHMNAQALSRSASCESLPLIQTQPGQYASAYPAQIVPSQSPVQQVGNDRNALRFDTTLTLPNNINQNYYATNPILAAHQISQQQQIAAAQMAAASKSAEDVRAAFLRTQQQQNALGIQMYPTTLPSTTFDQSSYLMRPEFAFQAGLDPASLMGFPPQTVDGFGWPDNSAFAALGNPSLPHSGSNPSLNMMQQQQQQIQRGSTPSNASWKVDW